MGLKKGTKIFFNEEKDEIIIFPVTAEAFRKGLELWKNGGGMMKWLMENKKQKKNIKLI